MQSMPSTKIAAFFREFPWLGKHASVNDSYLKAIFIKKIDTELLDKKSSIHITSLYGTYDYGLYKILDNEGNELIEVGYVPQKQSTVEPESWWNSFLQKFGLGNSNVFVTRNDFDGETVTRALDRLKRQNEMVAKATFILFKTNVHCSGDYGFIIYKPGKGFNLVNWIEKIKQDEIEEVKQEIENLKI